MGWPAWGRGGGVAVALVATVLACAGPGATPVGAAGSAAPTKVVSLTFDDGRVSQAAVDGLLVSHRMNGTFYIITGAVNTGGDNPESLTWAQIHRLAHHGNEIGAHTRTHPDLPTLSTAAQVREICGSGLDLSAHRLHATSFAYPYGDFTTTTERIVRHCGFASGRAAWGGAENIPPADPYALRTLATVTDTDTVAALEARVTTAKPGQWLQYVFHDIGDAAQDGDGYRISTGDFTALLDWLGRQRDHGTVVIRTVGSVAH